LYALELEGIPEPAEPLRNRGRRDIAPADRTLLERESELAVLRTLIDAGGRTGVAPVAKQPLRA
jgi:hypothetical protein